MGNFEKLVVLAVLLVAGIVLAISFERGDDAVEAADPLSGAEDVLARERVDPAADGAIGGETAPTLLLHAGEERAEPAAGTDALARELADAFPAAGLQSGAPRTGESVKQELGLEPASDPTRRILAGTVGLRPSWKKRCASIAQVSPSATVYTM